MMKIWSLVFCFLSVFFSLLYVFTIVWKMCVKMCQMLGFKHHLRLHLKETIECASGFCGGSHLQELEQKMKFCLFCLPSCSASADPAAANSSLFNFLSVISVVTLSQQYDTVHSLIHVQFAMCPEHYWADSEGFPEVAAVNADLWWLFGAN